jgi:hypothetical protein
MKKIPYEDLPPDALVRHADLPPDAHFCRSHQDQLVARGEFPPKRRISANRVGWLKSDIEAWRRARPVVEAGGGFRHTERARQKMKDAWVERRQRARRRHEAGEDKAR